MEAKFVGFVGRDCYDLVFYLARTALLLGGSCLVEDVSGSSMCMYVSDTQVRSGEAVDNRGVDISNGICMAGYSGYDYVFRYFGQSVDSPLQCEEVYFVTDGQLQEVGILQRVQSPSSFNTLVIRTRSGLKKRLNAVQMALAKYNFGENVLCLDFNEGDEAARLSVQYDSLPAVRGISAATVAFITGFFEVDYDKKQIKAAVRELLRGR